MLQAATNVALDLDTRPLPKFITLPRRRRRRRRPDAATAGANGPAAAATTGAAGGAEGANGASQAAADEPDRMGDMLAEEQVSLHAFHVAEHLTDLPRCSECLFVDEGDCLSGMRRMEGSYKSTCIL